MQGESGNRRALVVAGVVGLLAILVLQLALSIRQESITWDEDDHLYAGYMSWKTGDFGLNPEHPPMVKMLAALPILGMQLKVPELQRRNFKHEAFLGGKDFLFKNDANTMLFRARMMASLLTLLLAVLVFLAAQEMFSAAAAFLALTLLAFDPNLLAHGALVTTDAGLSCFLFASVYAFYRYVVRKPGLFPMRANGAALRRFWEHRDVADRSRLSKWYRAVAHDFVGTFSQCPVAGESLTEMPNASALTRLLRQGK